LLFFISKDIVQDEEILYNNISDISKPEKGYNCPEINNSGRSICDLIIQIIVSYEKKIGKSNELYEKYKNDPLEDPIISFYIITLFNRRSRFFYTF
jgi:hypothetical protein